LVVVLPVFLLLTACAATPDHTPSPLVTLGSIEKAAQPQQVVLQLNLQNRSDRILPVSTLRYRVDLEDVEFAWGTSRQSVEVPAYGVAVFDIVVPGRMPVVQAGQTHLRYNLSGMIHLAGARSPIAFAQDGRLNWQPATAP
jgi:LEA14-like dessication related protein